MGNRNFCDVFDFPRGRSDALIRCSCGHEQTVKAAQLVQAFDAISVAAACARAKCSVGDARGDAHFLHELVEEIARRGREIIVEYHSGFAAAGSISNDSWGSGRVIVSDHRSATPQMWRGIVEIW